MKNDYSKLTHSVEVKVGTGATTWLIFSFEGICQTGSILDDEQVYAGVPMSMTINTTKSSVSFSGLAFCNKCRFSELAFEVDKTGDVAEKPWCYIVAAGFQIQISMETLEQLTAHNVLNTVPVKTITDEEEQGECGC